MTDEPLNLNDDDNGPIDEKSLQQILQDYRKATEEEFAKGADEINDDSEGIANKAKELLVRCIPTAAATMQYLAEHSVSENIRLQASKYIMDNGLGKTGFATPADPIEELVKQLTVNKKAKGTADAETPNS